MPRIPAIAVICALAAALYGWRAGGAGLGNSYYAAAAKSMTRGCTDFLFGTFDPHGLVTVDKPPLSLWPQAISVWLFGFHGFALMLPQLLAGVATVFLLHRTVRRWAGERAALLAAVILALTPITVAINGFNNPDTLLVLLLVAAAYALTRALEPESAGTKWLLLCAFLLGCGFLAKMLQAWILVPGFALVYLLGAPVPMRRRLLGLLGAAVVLFVSSLWWVALHDWWPGRKPYMGGSTDGSAWNLVFGYNGFGRLFGGGGGAVPGGAPGPGGPGGAGMPVPPGAIMTSDDPGLLRMFNEAVGGQISWLLPLSLFVLLVIAVAAVRGRIPRAALSGWLLWASWLLLSCLVFSYTQGIFHPYYTTMLAPAVAAISAAGLAWMWRRYRRAHTGSWALLPVAVALTTAWAFTVAAREPDWHGWVRWVVLAAGALAVTGLVGARFGTVRPRRIIRPALVLGLLAMLLAPASWAGAAAIGTTSGGIPAAGPNSNAPQVSKTGNGIVVTGGMGPGDGGLSPVQRRMLDYAVRHGEGAAIDLAINSGAVPAAEFITGTGATVIGMGGFMGSDEVPSVARLRDWVRTGALRYVLAQSPKRTRGGMSSPAQQRRQDWITGHCTVVDPRAYGAAERKQRRVSGPAPDTLYRCGR